MVSTSIPVEFVVSSVGETTGESYKGVFKVRPRLSHRDTLRRDQYRRDLLGAQPETAGQDALSTALVFSKIWAHVTEAPSWWKDAGNGLDLLDEAPVIALYDEIQRIEREASEKLSKAAEQAKNDLAGDLKK